MKQKSLIVHCGGHVLTTGNGIISQEIFARIYCKRFTSEGIWTIGESLSLDAVEAVEFRQNSHLESEKVGIDLFCSVYFSA